MSDPARTGDADQPVPPSWKWRSFRLALPVMLLLAVPAVAIALRELTPNPVLRTAAMAVLLVLVLALITFVRRPQNAFRNDAVVQQITYDDATCHWSGPIEGLGPGNLEDVLRAAVGAYGRLRIESVADDGRCAKLRTNSGWTSSGTDVTIRHLAPETVAAPDAGTPAAARFEFVNSSVVGNPDMVQEIDDLARLVHLVKVHARPRSATAA